MLCNLLVGERGGYLGYVRRCKEAEMVVEVEGGGGGGGANGIR